MYDMWTSKDFRHAYLGIVGGYIDKAFEYKEVLIKLSVSSSQELNHYESGESADKNQRLFPVIMVVTEVAEGYTRSSLTLIFYPMLALVRFETFVVVVFKP